MNKYYKIFAMISLALLLAQQGELRADESENSTADKAQVVNYFDVMEYRVEGNTLLAKGRIEEAVYPHLGEKKSIEDVEKARTSLEKIYHEAGYLTVLVDIPEQDVANGTVILNVTEGKVGNLRVKGSKYFSLGRIKALAPSVAEGEVPYFPGVQKDMASLNRTADKRVTPVMRAGKAFGTVDVDLKVDDTLPLHASLELNDQYSQNTSHLRLAGTVRYDNLWQREHSLSLSFQVSPEDTDQVKVLSANYLWRFDNTDTMLAMYGVRSKSNVATVGGFNVIGNGTIVGVRLIQPLPSLENYSHSISVGADYKHFGQSQGVGDQVPVTYAPLNISYNGTEQDDIGQTQFIGSLNFNLRGVVSDETEFANKRFGASPNFFILKADVQRTQKLPWDAQAFLRLDGQFSGQELISNEQFMAGGSSSVRGYLEAEVPGDRALHSTLEVRSPQLLHNVSKVQDLRLLAFYDAAKLWWVGDTGSVKHPFLAGAGFGLRFKGFNNLNAELDIATPLHKGDVTESGDIRSHARLWYEF